MTFLILSILFSTLLVFIFKAFPKYEVDTFQAIVINYFVCVITGSFVLGEFPINAETPDQFWFPYALALGLIFITGFNFTAFTVQKFGITIGAVMQKMSIIFSVSWALLMYGESMTLMKGAGILAAVAAIVLTNIRSDNQKSESEMIPKWWYIFPALTLIFSGVMEILLFEVEQKSATSGDLGFVATLFGIAGIFGFVFLVGGLLSGKLKWKMQNLWAGIVLGVPNFFSIYFLMKAIGFGWEGSVVFPVNNVAIIGLSAILAYFLISEKLSKMNWLGVALAGLSILLIAVG